MKWLYDWGAWQGVGTVAAVVVALGLQLWAGRVRKIDIERSERNLREQIARSEADRKNDEEQRRREQQRSLYIELTLRIAEDFEAWNAQHAATADRVYRLMASLSALPVAYLQILRHEFGVMPDARHTARIASYGQTKSDKARDEIRSLLYGLTGAGTDQDCEPPGSPTGNRPPAPLTFP